MNFLSALKWSFLAELSSKAIAPVIYIILARLLTPEDFGVMSAAMMVIAFSQIFWEAGMSKALIQRQTDVDDAANFAFWVNIALGMFIAFLLFLTAEPIALIFFQDERVKAVLRVMTLQVLLGALSSVQTALLQKQMSFKKLFWVRLSTVCLPCMASIPLAWAGLGYWAIVSGTLTGQAVQILMLWRMSQWRPALRFPLSVAKPMSKFGAWVGVSGLLGWFYVWADSLIVGKYLGIHNLGLYRTGNQFSALVFATVFGPITPVLYSHLAKMYQNKNLLRNAIEKVIKVITLTAVPGAILLFSFSEKIGIAVFGERWDGIGFVIGVIALMHGISWIVGMNGEFYRAMAKPSYETIVTASTLAVYLFVYIYAAQISFKVFVWARFILAIVAFFLHIFILKVSLGIKMSHIIFRIISIAFLSFSVVVTVQLLVTPHVNGVWAPILLCAGGSTFIVALLISFIERNGIVREVISFSRTGHP